jgi:hypothetical protein
MVALFGGERFEGLGRYGGVVFKLCIPVTLKGFYGLLAVL